ncbi:hypothetical protein HN446_01005 [bacterium]|jgi:hypothetical protein|nr:hypothetical protein [bacterium]
MNKKYLFIFLAFICLYSSIVMTCDVVAVRMPSMESELKQAVQAIDDGTWEKFAESSCLLIPQIHMSLEQLEESDAETAAEELFYATSVRESFRTNHGALGNLLTVLGELTDGYEALEEGVDPDKIDDLIEALRKKSRKRRRKE